MNVKANLLFSIVVLTLPFSPLLFQRAVSSHWYACTTGGASFCDTMQNHQDRLRAITSEVKNTHPQASEENIDKLITAQARREGIL